MSSTWVNCISCNEPLATRDAPYCTKCGSPQSRTKECVHCKAQLPPVANFCLQCGKPQGHQQDQDQNPSFKWCIQCKAELPSDARFCMQCSKPQPSIVNLKSLKKACIFCGRLLSSAGNNCLFCTAPQSHEELTKRSFKKCHKCGKDLLYESKVCIDTSCSTLQNFPPLIPIHTDPLAIAQPPASHPSSGLPPSHPLSGPPSSHPSSSDAPLPSPDLSSSGPSHPPSPGHPSLSVPSPPNLSSSGPPSHPPSPGHPSSSGPPPSDLSSSGPHPSYPSSSGPPPSHPLLSGPPSSHPSSSADPPPSPDISLSVCPPSDLSSSGPSPAHSSVSNPPPPDLSTGPAVTCQKIVGDYGIVGDNGIVGDTASDTLVKKHKQPDRNQDTLEVSASKSSVGVDENWVMLEDNVEKPQEEIQQAKKNIVDKKTIDKKEVYQLDGSSDNALNDRKKSLSAPASPCTTSQHDKEKIAAGSSSEMIKRRGLEERKEGVGEIDEKSDGTKDGVDTENKPCKIITVNGDGVKANNIGNSSSGSNSDSRMMVDSHSGANKSGGDDASGASVSENNASGGAVSTNNKSRMDAHVSNSSNSGVPSKDNEVGENATVTNEMIQKRMAGEMESDAHGRGNSMEKSSAKANYFGRKDEIGEKGGTGKGGVSKKDINNAKKKSSGTGDEDKKGARTRSISVDGKKKSTTEKKDEPNLINPTL